MSNIEQQWANVDLANSLSTSPDTTTENEEISLVTDKLTRLREARDNKLNSLAASSTTKINNNQFKDYEDVTIIGMEDADTFKLSDGREVRASDSLYRYDAAEVEHPESLWGSIKSAVGLGNSEKSDYAEQTQREHVGRILGKNPGVVTEEDIYSVGNMQQVQALSDLIRNAGDERWIAEVEPGAAQVDLNSGLNIGAKIKVSGTDAYGRVLADVVNPNTGENITRLHAQDPRLNAFAPGYKTAGYKLDEKGNVVDTIDRESSRIANFAKGVPSTIGKSVVGVADSALEFLGKGFGDTIRLVDEDSKFADFVEGTLDLGVKENRDKVIDSVTGYDTKYSAPAQLQLKALTAKIQERENVDPNIVTKVLSNVAEATKKVPFLNQLTETLAGVSSIIDVAESGEVLEYVETAFSTPEVALESMGDIIVMAAAKGKGITLRNKEIGALRKDIEADLKAKKGVDAEKAAKLKDLQAQRTMLDKGASVLSDNIGVVAISSSYVNDAADEFKAMYGRDMTYTEKLGSLLVTVPFMMMDKAVAIGNIKGVQEVAAQFKKLDGAVPKQMLVQAVYKSAKAASTLGAAGVKEFLQEIPQTIQQEMLKYDLINEDFTVNELSEENKAKLLNESVVAGALAFGAGAHMATPAIAVEALSSTVGKGKNSIQELLNKRANSVKDTVDSVEETVDIDDIVAKAADAIVMSKNTALDTKSKISSIREAEELVYRLNENDPKRAKLSEALTQRKQELSKEVEDLEDVQEYSKVLGSKAAFLDLIDDVMEVNDNVISGKLEDNLRKIAESFGINEQSFKQIKKDYETVDLEATKSSRGYMTQGKALRAILEAASPDVGKAEKLISRMQNFENSQKKYLEVANEGISQVQAIVDTYNNELKKGNNLAKAPAKQYSFNVGKKSVIKINTGENPDGTYFVNIKPFQPTLDATQRNIDGIRRELKKSADLLKKAGIGQETTGFQTEIILDLDSIVDKGMKRAVQLASKYFSKKGVNAYIALPSEAKDRNAYLLSGNEQVTNKSEYSSDDVVGVLLPNINTQAQFDNFAKEVRNANSVLRKQLAAAQKAGATIVLNLDIGAKEFKYEYKTKSGKKATKQLSAIALVTNNIVGFGRGYESTGNAEGKKVSYTFKPSAIAKAERESKQNIAKEKAEKAAKKTKDLNDKFESYIEYGDTSLKGVEEYFSGDKAQENLEKYLDSRLDSEVDSYIKAKRDIDKKLDQIAKLEKRITSEATYAVEAASKAAITALNKEIRELESKLESLELIKDIAEDRIKDKEVDKKQSKDLLTKYRKALESDKITGENTAEEFLGDYAGESEVSLALENSVSKGMKPVYLKTVINEEGKSKTTVASKEDEGAVESLTDINSIVQESANGSILGLVPVEDMFEGIELEDGSTISSTEYIAASKEFLKNKLAKREARVSDGKYSTLEWQLKDSPAYGLIMSKDGINDTVVMAMRLALDEYISNNMRMLSATYKSKEDAAQMVGVLESMLGKNQYALLKDKGVFKKTIDNEIGRAVVGKLGLRAKAGIETEAFNKVVAELGQMATWLGVNDGLLEEVEVSVKEYQKAISDDNPDSRAKFSGDSTEATVRFIREKLVKGEKQKEAFTNVIETYKKIHEVVAEESMFRKEPSRSRIHKSKRRHVKEQVSKDVIGTKIPKGKPDGKVSAEEAINTLIDTEWEYNVELINEVKGLMKSNPAVLKKWLGYKTDQELEKMAYETRDAAIATNRDIDKSIEELLALVENPDSSNKLYFDWFYTANGRYMLDSNTVNPQTDKQLHRWLITPVKHMRNYVVKDGKFTINGKDVTTEVKYAIAQAFGFAVDKKKTKKLLEFADKILSMDKDQITEMKKSIFEEGKAFKFEGIEIEPEHIGHMLQGIDFVLKAKNSEFSSNLSAEFDAVTSGFGLKLLQMPILSDIWKWLNKVGVFKASQIGDYKSMNDILDSTDFYGKDTGKFYDSYQTLGVDSVIDVNEIKDPTAKAMYSRLESVLPKLDEDGGVSKALRVLFKDPFMTFNYSAGIKSIRASLSNKLMYQVIDGIAEGDPKYDEVAKKLASYVDLDVEVLVDKIRTEPLDRIKLGEKSNLEKQLLKAMDESYGAKVEEIMTKNFGKFIEAHNKINSAFRAMFEVFNIEYKKEIAKVKSGELTDVKKLEIIDKLREKFPLIKGPLSESIEDGVGIYGRVSVTPKAEEARVSPAQTYIYEKGKITQSKARHMIKEFEAAMSAGSVVPIHYIDGALMAQILYKGSAITSIHDAFIPPIDEAGKKITEYNRNMIEVGMNYSVVEAINDMLNRVEITEDYKKELNKTVINAKIPSEEEYGDIGVGNYFTAIKDEVAMLASEVKEGRENLKNEIDSGVMVGHVAGFPGSMWSNVAENKEESKQEEAILQKEDSVLIDEAVTTISKLIADSSGKAYTKLLEAIIKDIEGCR